jgi:hypothetical protein
VSANRIPRDPAPSRRISLPKSRPLSERCRPLIALEASAYKRPTVEAGSRSTARLEPQSRRRCRRRCIRVRVPVRPPRRSWSREWSRCRGRSIGLPLPGSGASSSSEAHPLDRKANARVVDMVDLANVLVTAHHREPHQGVVDGDSTPRPDLPYVPSLFRAGTRSRPRYAHGYGGRNLYRSGRTSARVR